MQVAPVAGAVDLDSPRWDDLPRHVLVDVATGAPPRWPTDVSLSWDPESLWVRFACRASTVRATMTDYKDRVWQEDAVEVYLQPPGDPDLYEFQLSPIGTARDLRVTRPGEADQAFDDSWSCDGMRTQARILRGADRGIAGWQALFGLPWASVGAVAPTDPGWRVGLFRIERDPEEFSGVRWCARPDLELHDPRLMATLSTVAVDRHARGRVR